MSSYDNHIDALEDLDTSGFSDAQKEALEVSKDCLAFTSALHNHLASVGAKLPENPEIPLLESMIDAVFCELMAAVLVLVDIPDSDNILKSVAKELYEANLNKQAGVDPQMIQGYLKLAERVERSKAALKQLDA